MIIKSSGPELAPPPDDLTLPQFILDTEHPLRQIRSGKVNNRPWLIEDETGKSYSFEELRARTFGLANALAKRWAVDYPTTIWATHRIGAIASCANPAYTESELQHQLQVVKASLLIVHPASLTTGLAAARASGLSAHRVVLMTAHPSPTESSLVLPTVDELVQEGLASPPAFKEKRLERFENQKKIAFLSFSSGTTGKPKLSLVVFSRFSWIDFLRSIVKYKITHLFVVPPMVVLFAKPPTWQRKAGTPGSAGQLISGTEAKVVKPDGSLAKYGEMGELYVRGPQGRFNRYLDNPAANAETFVDGWVRTGDEVMFHENGDMFIIDRLKELIKCRGFQVAPAELEGHLLDHSDVLDACVVGVPDDFAGEVPLAFIVLSRVAAERVAKDPSSAAHIKNAIRKHVSDVKVRYKWLEGGVEFVEAIPKNPSGKLLRRFLRDKAKEIVKARSPAVKAKL
ncbi:hypothetical protein FRB99_006619 [Tulasnella sp. 403]|nr:hypothetical protein FRB99_006619 [Tulasnella sp. 403]